MINLDLTESDSNIVRYAFIHFISNMWKMKDKLKKAIADKKTPIAVRCALHEELKEVNDRLEKAQALEFKLETIINNQVGV